MRFLALSLALLALLACSPENSGSASTSEPGLQKSPRECDDPDAAEQALKALNLVPADNSITIPNAVIGRISQFLLKDIYTGWCHDVSPRTNNVRTTGPYVDGRAITTHARVRVFYSKGVVNWLEGGRRGAIPDGSMIVKEMHPMPEEVSPNEPPGARNAPTGWALMVRDAQASHDGWLWYLFYLPKNETNDIEFLSVQHGLSFCVSCHASTDTDQNTFAFLGNLENRDVATYVGTSPVIVAEGGPVKENSRPGPHGQMATMDQLLETLMYQPTLPANKKIDRNLLALFREQIGSDLEVPEQSMLKRLPEDAFFDHVVAKPGVEKEHFLTGDACAGCHDTSNLLNTIDPAMAVPLPKPIKTATGEFTDINASPYGEWSASMMSRSSRDPVFRAQFEYELATLSTDKARSEVATLCMSCHAVMGERQFPDHVTDPDNFYAILDPDEPEHGSEQITNATYGALARDGVSCAVCHHISDEGLGGKASFTANFELGPADEVYGPFSDVKTHPMRQALGLTPTHGAQIQDAALCGSCHTIQVPVFNGQTIDKHVYEQTTYMEWANSVYASPTTDGQTCQECHMPNADPVSGRSMTTKIANIEDTTFPYVPNRANSVALDISPRSNYRRHTLVGINVFVMSMFQEFPLLLGSNTWRPNRSPALVPPPVTALQAALEQAQQKTATIKIQNIQETKGQLEINVEVENLAGHKLPSGVGFRRAFIELSVRNQDGVVIWCSGCSNDLGVLVGGTGEALPSEFTQELKAAQPDYAMIDQQSQVQIYESRHTDCDGQLTTSFIRLCNEVKDNRLLPRGWSATGSFADETKPVGLVGDLDPGRDQIQYRATLPQGEQAASVTATLQYQSIPPYYLLDRFRLLTSTSPPGTEGFPETERLLYMVLHLNVEAPEVSGKGWKLALASTQTALRPSMP